jgi:hypothetical protein
VEDHKIKHRGHIRSADCLGINLAQSNSSNLALLDILCEYLDGLLNGESRVLSRTFENIKFLLAIEQTQTFVHATTDVLFRAIRGKLALLQATFDTKNDLVCVPGVLGEVLVEEMQRVVLRSAI